MRLLMIDDDESLADAIAQHLIKQHYAVDIATNGQMGLEFVDLFKYDLIILDLMLPDINGSQLCKRIRQEHQMPILMLTAQDNADAKISGLDSGADDYIVKPIHLPELLARIRALLRRTAPQNTPQLNWGDLTLDPSSFETTYGDKPVSLTPKEYAILELFLRHPHHSQTLDGIIDNIWALESPPSLYAIRTHIKCLRQKLKTAGAPSDFIETLYGFGYRLKPDYETPVDETPDYETPDNETSSPASPPQEDPSLKSQIESLTQDLWQKHKGEMEARISVLEAIANTPTSLPSSLKEEGIIVAHKLAGVLGCFDFAEGSQLARKIETYLKTVHTETEHKNPDFQKLVAQLRQSIKDSPQVSIERSTPLIVYSSDEGLTQGLIAQQRSYGMVVTPVGSQPELITQLKSTPSGLVLLDLTNPSQSLEMLDQINSNYPQSSTFMLLHDGAWLDRIDYVQHGVRRIFQAPATPDSILEAVQQFSRSTHARAKVMLVDDDKPFLSLMSVCLETYGFEISTLSDSSHFWSNLKQTHPDILILDFEMPKVNGLELCQILRADPGWSHLPIIFLSSHEDEQTEDQVFQAGADDFISKRHPVNRLILRIQNRLR